MIRISGLCKSFGGARVLAGVDAEVSEGKIVALLGASGSGKSTLLRCLNGLETFDSGVLEVAGFALSPGKQDERMLQALRAKVGMVFQEFHLFPHLSVLDNVTLAPRIAQRVAREKAEAEARELLAQVGLEGRAQALPRELSGGQKQRVAIARALAQGVRVLLLDEPTSALDPDLREEVREVLRRVARDVHHENHASHEIEASVAAPGLTILLVTHEHELAHELADEIWTLDAGKIVERRAPERRAINSRGP
ncbi:MAG TPA: amino acid ABC transporter ATP-binding protein [Polyangiaceae bacterium]|jgi:ABC-type polar amino acid transport system ATPase subunit|nr:amino acid ABC transporter ATP-binding protein [Polyangiaceae bacterium]